MKTVITKCDFSYVMGQKDPDRDYFDEGFTQASSKEDYTRRFANRTDTISPDLSMFEPPRIIKPTKTHNRIRGVLDKSKYINGEQDCLVGKSPAKDRHVYFIVNCTASSGIEIEEYRERAKYILSAYHTLLEAGYLPEIVLSDVAVYNKKGIRHIYMTMIPSADPVQVAYMLSDVDTFRYIMFKCEDVCTDVTKFGHNDRESFISDLYDNGKGRPDSISKEDLMLLGFNNSRVVGSYEGMKYSDETNMKRVKTQLQNDMKAL